MACMCVYVLITLYSLIVLHGVDVTILINQVLIDRYLNCFQSFAITTHIALNHYSNMSFFI